jgi:hypothetical protein
MIRAALAAIAVAALAAPAAEASASAAALPWLSATCGGIVALQHDAAYARLATSPAAVRKAAAAVSTDVARVRTATAAAPAVQDGAALAAELASAARNAQSALTQHQRTLGLHTTRVAIRAYAASATAVARTLGSTFARLLAKHGSPDLDRAVDQVPTCRVVSG